MITDDELQRLKTQAQFMATVSEDGGERQRHWLELTDVFSELQGRREKDKQEITT